MEIVEEEILDGGEEVVVVREVVRDRAVVGVREGVRDEASSRADSAPQKPYRPSCTPQDGMGKDR